MKICNDCGSSNTKRVRSSNRLLNPTDGIIPFSREVCAECGSTDLRTSVTKVKEK